jgi:uncharacterized repeat protein (TIGR03833 family)
MSARKSGRHRDALRVGLAVDIIQKKDQHSGRLTRGRVKEILTASSTHPHGIKVRLEDGGVGRVAGIIDTEADGKKTEQTDKNIRYSRQPVHHVNPPEKCGDDTNDQR